MVGAFLIGCAVLLLAVGCSGTSSETSKKEEQGCSPQATESEEEARCEGTRKIKWSGGPNPGGVYTTNDLPGCPNKGGLLLGTDGPDTMTALSVAEAASLDRVLDGTAAVRHQRDGAVLGTACVEKIIVATVEGTNGASGSAACRGATGKAIARLAIAVCV